MNDHAPNPLRRALALGVLALCVGLGVMLCTVGLAANLVPSLPVATAPPSAPAVRWLTWDRHASGDTNLQYVVKAASTRAGLSNAAPFTIATNGMWVTNGFAYSIAFLKGTNTAAPAFWPSNAVYVPQVEYSTDLTTWLPGQEFPEVTNTPVKLVRMVNKFKRWE